MRAPARSPRPPRPALGPRGRNTERQPRVALSLSPPPRARGRLHDPPRARRHVPVQPTRPATRAGNAALPRGAAIVPRATRRRVNVRARTPRYALAPRERRPALLGERGQPL